MKWVFVVVVIWGAWMLLRKPAKPRYDKRGLDDAAAARRLLGVGRDADADAIRAAHRRLAAEVHPDRGGSAETARRVNAARDLLLKELR